MPGASNPDREPLQGFTPVPPTKTPASRASFRWRRRRDSNPRSGFCPDAPLAGECLRPLGHVSDNSHCTVSGTLLQPKGFMQRPNGQFHVFILNHDRDLDLTGRNHLDIDTLSRQGLKH